MINVTPCFYKIILFKNFYDIANNHANLLQNDAQVFYEHNRSKIRALHPKIIGINLSAA